MAFLHLFLSGIMLIIFSTLAKETYDGYTFVFSGKKAYLYDMDKKVVNEWSLPYSVAACADLLRDSSILVPSAVYGDAGKDLRGIPLPGGRLQIIDWKGNVTWEFTYAGRDYLPHHDIEPVYRTNDPLEKPTILIVVATRWGDKIVEIRPKGKNDADIIWEWAASDHRCYSDCTDKTGLIDGKKRTNGGSNDSCDIMHTNNVSYNPFLDQIIINMKGFYEFIVVDHSTTTEEAKGSSGGRYGKGGEILYRWGNPRTYGAPGETFFNGQHGACWVPLIMPGTTDSIQGGGNFLAVDNGNRRVVEIGCPGKKNGIYPRNMGEAFGPDTVLWDFKPKNLQFNEGSIQKLPNGNYLICAGGLGKGGGDFVYEVTSDSEIVWELSGIDGSTEACRYAYSYLDGKTAVSHKKNNVDLQQTRIYVFGADGKLIIKMNSLKTGDRLSLYSFDGKVLIRQMPANCSNGWQLPCSLPKGAYFLQSGSGKDSKWEKIFLH